MSVSSPVFKKNELSLHGGKGRDRSHGRRNSKVDKGDAPCMTGGKSFVVMGHSPIGLFTVQ